ncbi:hypothetical protein GCM10010052_41780 [Paenarthrobacter histidinolovorans]|nr:hypothetical protein GCM10010052_41780 [Paenarthrobacter histidinolovorans]
MWDAKNINAGRWQLQQGETVEVWIDGSQYRNGVVDEVLPDGSAFWLAGDGPSTREFIERSRGFHLWRDTA